MIFGVVAAEKRHSLQRQKVTPHCRSIEIRRRSIRPSNHGCTINKMWRILTVAAHLQAAFALPLDHHSDLQQRDDGRQIGYISVSVATLWTNPHKPRPVDQPALTNPVNIKKWLHDMTDEQSLDLTDSSRTQAQALYGNQIYVLQSKDGWYEIAVPGQPTPKNKLGYPGWVPACQISFDTTFGELQTSLPFAQVDKAPWTSIYRDVDMTDEYMEISYDTKLPAMNQFGTSIQVAVPGGGSAYVSAANATVYNSRKSIPYPTGENLVTAGSMFLGRPYLWGGQSGWAYDCSGFTHTIYDAHGITIGRDASAQAAFTGHGVHVSKDELRPGDIIFYASNLSDPDTIYHDAMYAGKRMMMEAYGSGVPTRLTKVRFNEDYWGAERFLHD